MPRFGAATDGWAPAQLFILPFLVCRKCRKPPSGVKHRLFWMQKVQEVQKVVPPALARTLKTLIGRVGVEGDSHQVGAVLSRAS